MSYEYNPRPSVSSARKERKKGRKEVKNKDDALRPLGRRDVVVGLNGVCFCLENGLWREQC